MKKLIFILSIMIIFGVANLGSATLVLDQTSPTGNSSLGVSNAYTWQQEVVVGKSGLLSAVELCAYNATINFYINKGQGWQSDANDFSISGLQLLNNGWQSIDVSSANLLFNQGDTFVIGITGTSYNPSATLGGMSSPQGYSPGDLYIFYYGSGNLVNKSDQTHVSMAFNTYMDSAPTPTPIPAAFWLLGSGLIGLVGLRRKFRK